MNKKLSILYNTKTKITSKFPSFIKLNLTLQNAVIKANTVDLFQVTNLMHNSFIL